jgi:lysophospholipase L1-like esterase
LSQQLVDAVAPQGETCSRDFSARALSSYRDAPLTRSAAARAYKNQPEDIEVYSSYLVVLYEQMARSCADAGIPVLDLYQLYDGPDADPALPETAGTSDGVHVSDEGDAVIAELLSELGYASFDPQ